MINTLIEHQRLSITFAETLQRLSEDDWRRKIAPDKWSIAEIMGHFRFWDAFLLTKRVPFFFTTQQFEPSPNVDLINEQSAAYARVTEKDKVLAEFIIHRQQIVEQLLQFSPQQWEKMLKIGDTELTVLHYFIISSQNPPPSRNVVSREGMNANPMILPVLIC